MLSDSLLQHILEQVEGSHYSFIRFVGRVCRHEWDWSPDDGIQSARDVVGNVMREEGRLASRYGRGAAPAIDEAKDLATPAVAAATLRRLREATLGALQRLGFDSNADSTLKIAQSAITLAQLDAHALGELVMLQRLVDPSRATMSPK